MSESTTEATFDLENELLCPKANVSCFFYIRKLTVFNFTAHVSDGKHKEGYCAIWHEGIGGFPNGSQLAKLEVTCPDKTRNVLGESQGRIDRDAKTFDLIRQRNVTVIDDDG
jgi:hypothetical protein